MTAAEFRELTNEERAVLKRLLEKPFPGREQITRQLDTASVREVTDYKDQYGSLEFKVETKVKAPTSQRVPVEAMGMDQDDVPIEYLLHVVDGTLAELEIVKADGSRIQRMPRASELKVRVRTEVTN